MESGEIPEAPGETWQKIHAALRHGIRGLGGESSLAPLKAAEKGIIPAGKLIAKAHATGDTIAISSQE